MKPGRHVPILQGTDSGIELAMAPSWEVVDFTESNENLNGRSLNPQDNRLNGMCVLHEYLCTEVAFLVCFLTACGL